jgi:hypothetical protein
MHLANHGSRNIGNAALILGLERVLREDLREAAFVPESWDLYSRGVRRFGPDFVERVNRDADALLVGAAVAFDGAGLYQSTGFRFDLPVELWAHVDRPIVLYGLSHRTWPRRPYLNRDALRAALTGVLTRPNVLFSVRNDGTKEWLESVAGEPLGEVRVVPDPAVYVPVNDVPHLELDSSRPNVIVAPNGEDTIERFGVLRRKRAPRIPTRMRQLPFTSTWGWREHRAGFLRALARAVDRIAKNHDANVILCAHEPTDVVMASELFDYLDGETRYNVTYASAVLPVAAGASFYDLYAKADLVLGMRIHSFTPAIGLGTPVVPLVSQDRMRNFACDVGIADLCIEIFDPDVEESIVAKASNALGDPESVRVRLRAAHDNLRARTAAFDAEVAAHVRG